MAAEEGRRVQGVAGRFKGASAGISSSAPEFGRPASVSAGIAGSVASARHGGDEAGRRGPQVSGGAHCERAERATRGCADVRAQAVSEGERERADAKLGRAGRALASGVKGWAGVESGSRGEGERKEVGLMGFLGRAGFWLVFLF